VYFPGDGKIKDVTHDQVRLEQGEVKAPRRRDLLNKQFFCDGDGDDFPPGTWIVRRIQGNTYVCSRLTGAANLSQRNLEEFDIGYVISQFCSQQ